MIIPKKIDFIKMILQWRYISRSSVHNKVRPERDDIKGQKQRRP